MSADDIQQLQAIFPDASAEALAAVLELSGDVAVATDYLLSNEGALEEVENGLRAGQGDGAAAVGGGGGVGGGAAEADADEV